MITICMRHAILTKHDSLYLQIFHFFPRDLNQISSSFLHFIPIWVIAGMRFELMYMGYEPIVEPLQHNLRYGLLDSNQ